ncbi:hypothetical protein O181_017039 [Austropuccinia psidii MF-1]|uniref:Uncharacterized protein n=1 Tax=Austropuccinia psidii MF-1 TaxID=1389203 RepID=A0A9Q3GSE0_9BASI|nr:hypothetical protein [Austropuccinia psidii MF-1]
MSFENEKDSVDKDPYEWCLRPSKRLKAIDPQMKIKMTNNKILTQIPGELKHSIKCRCNQNCTLADIANTLQYKLKERKEEVNKKRNSCQNCGSKDFYANNFPKEKKKVYEIQQVPEEEFPTEDSESDSMGDAIREDSDDGQDSKAEFLVKYQEETQLEIQDIQMKAGMPQDN